MKKPVKIVMLPTNSSEGTSSLVLQKCIKLLSDVNIGELRLTPRIMHSDEYFQEQHLYITVSQDVEPIKEGDYFYYPMSYMGNIKSFIEQYDLSKHCNPLPKDCRKIITTTDPKLTNLIIQGEEDYFNYDDGKKLNTNLLIPQLSQSFLKEYVANPNREWEVEYINLCLTFGKQKNLCFSCKEDCNMIPKLNQDNTVNLTLVNECEHPFKRIHWVGDTVFCNKCKTTLVKSEGEGKMYSKQEVGKLIRRYSKECTGQPWFNTNEDWINENL